MSKYEEMTAIDLGEKVSQYLGQDPQRQAARVLIALTQYWPYAYPVMNALMEITGGVFLNEDGSATTEINGKQETATGGHCRAICVLFLMAKDAQNQLQNS